jgi:hypothetical protein
MSAQARKQAEGAPQLGRDSGVSAIGYAGEMCALGRDGQVAFFAQGRATMRAGCALRVGHDHVHFYRAIISAHVLDATGGVIPGLHIASTLCIEHTIVTPQRSMSVPEAEAAMPHEAVLMPHLPVPRTFTHTLYRAEPSPPAVICGLHRMIARLCKSKPGA